LRVAKPAAKAYKLAIGGGLYLEVMPGGSKLWRWKYRIGGKENRYAMGSYPELSFKEAREETEAARKLVKQGVHPAQQKRLDRMQSGQVHANTFETIAKEWLALKDWEDITKKRRLDMLTRVVFPHIGKLPVQAVKLLRGMLTITGDKNHLFPHRDNRAKPMVAASLRQMLNVLGWGGKFSPHATRTTGSTRLNEMGYSADWIERQLAHEEPNSVRRTYNHADYLKNRATMMQQWADLLDEWKKGGSNIVPIKPDVAA